MNVKEPALAASSRHTSSSSAVRALQVRAFALTWVSYASYYLTRKNFSVVKSHLNRHLGVSIEWLAWIDTVYLAAYAMGQFINGALGDRFGPRRVIGVGMLASATMALVFGFSNVAILFMIAFGVNGYFQSTGWPNNVKAMAPWLKQSSRGWVMGLWCTNYQVGGLVATALATFLLVHFGWRAAFWVPAIWVAFVGLMIFLFLVERPQDRGLPASAEEREPAVASEDGVADKRGAMRDLIKMPVLWILGAAYFGLKLIRYSLLFWLPYYLHNHLGYDEGTAGYLSVSFEGGGIVGAVLVGWLSDRFFADRRMRLAAPMILMLAGALVLFQKCGTLGVAANVAGLALIGFLLFGPDALICGASAQEIGGTRAAASAAGFINGCGSIGAILQGFVTAYVSQNWGWEALFKVFFVMALFSGTALLILAFMKAPMRRG